MEAAPTICPAGPRRSVVGPLLAGAAVAFVPVVCVALLVIAAAMQGEPGSTITFPLVYLITLASVIVVGVLPGGLLAARLSGGALRWWRAALALAASAPPALLATMLAIVVAGSWAADAGVEDARAAALAIAAGLAVWFSATSLGAAGLLAVARRVGRSAVILRPR
jgi:hypothetical protein